MKPDEALLMREMLADYHSVSRRTPRDIAEQIGMHPKRLISICGKWARKGVYEYGVSVDLGWLTERALNVRD